MSGLGEISDVRLIVTLPAGQYSPSELRQKFAAALRETIIQSALDGHIENLIADELLRTISDQERIS